jgi:hypothetical protein
MSEKSSNPSSADLSIDSLSLPEDFPSDSNDQLNNDSNNSNNKDIESLSTKKKRKKKKRNLNNSSSSSSFSYATLSNSSSRKATKDVDVRKEKEELIEGEEEEAEVVLEESAVGPEELHRACWKGDLELIRKLLKVNKGREQLNQRDRHGNPPLHIALHLRHKDIISYLLSEGADPTAKNGGGWNSLQEAVASAERETAMQIYMASMQEMQRRFYTRVPKLMDAVEHVGETHPSFPHQIIHSLLSISLFFFFFFFDFQIPNFYMELQWEFRSWVPLVSRFCPSDKYRIWKQGSNLRADTTLVGFQNFRWVRGNVSIVFSGRDTGVSLPPVLPLISMTDVFVL